MSEYPSERDLRTLKRMDPIGGRAVVAEVLRLWNYDYGRAVWRGGYLRLVTGGWSGNEDIIASLPKLFGMFYWHMSRRGGLHVYKVFKMKEVA